MLYAEKNKRMGDIIMEINLGNLSQSQIIVRA